jgi:hypothetical protein
MRTRLRRERAGVSEVIGAMMLIIVVVVAVASLGLFVSYAQKQAFNSQNYLTNVQNDNLQVVYAQFLPNAPTIQWELDGCGPMSTGNSPPEYTGDWYVQQTLSNPTVVTLIPKVFAHHGAAITNGAQTVQANLAGGSFNAIFKGENASLSPGGSPSALYTLTLGGSPCTLNPATWDNITLTIRNTNTQVSSLAGVEVDTAGIQHPANTTWQVNQTGYALSTLSTKLAPLVIPARATVNVMLNSTSFGRSSTGFTKNSSLSIAVLSSVGNRFSTEYTGPTAIASSSGFAEQYQGVTRDVVTLNASRSYGTGSSIQTYEWAIDVPLISAGCNTSSFGLPAHFVTVYLFGPLVQYNPDSPGLSGSTDCLTGPIRATLTVTDQNGFASTSPPLILSPDPNIDPVGSISASKPSSCTPSSCSVTPAATDSFGNLMCGVVINAVPVYGDVMVSPPSVTTCGTTTTFTITFTNGGAVDFETGALQPVQVAFP